MKLNCNSFFDGDFKEINLNEFLKDDYNCKRPDLIQKKIDSLGYLTYGGYGENRKDMFKGSYLSKTKKFYHLGIDINVKAGTVVKCPFDCKIVNYYYDKDTDIGWGGRLILESENNKYLILAHLEPFSSVFNFQMGNDRKKNDYLGMVGTWPANGNVFEHLHIQCINYTGFEDFDGYGTKKDLENNPNPFEVEF